jgi:hypothetical protein
MKKGEVSTSFVVGIILLLIGFVLVLAVFSQIAFNETNAINVCHSSVILRATSPIDSLKNYVPLNCYTKKVCLSTLLGGKCNEGQESFAGEKSITKIRIDTSDAENAKLQIEKAIAREALECWTMMGEGKVGVFNEEWYGDYGFGETKSSCVICSRIDVDKSLVDAWQKDLAVLSKADPFEYMRTHKAPNTQISYLDAISGDNFGNGFAYGGGEVNLEGLDSNYFSNVNINEIKSKLSEQEKNQKDFEELAVIFMQVKTESIGDVAENWGQTLLLAGSTSALFAPKFTLTSLFSITKTAIVYWPVTLAVVAIGGGAITLNTWNNQAITSSYCGDISFGAQSEKGCSVLRVVKYNIDEISKFCGAIDGYP